MFVVQVTPEHPEGSLSRVSSEAYTTLSEAQTFVLSRSDNPVEFSTHVFESAENLYLIFDVKVS